MNNKAKNLFRNLRYTISANLSILIISVVLNLFVPRILGIKEYSYWQLYVFYSSYVGFLHFGWLDGIYLKIGGDEYDNLDKVSLNVQFWYLFVSQIFIAFGIVLYVLLRHDSGEKSLILLCTAVVTIITNLRMFILYIFQSTNRIKEYANLSRFDRYIYIVFIFIYLFLGGRSFVVLAVSDIFSRLIVTLWGIYQINDIVFNKVKRGKKYFSEILENIKIGSNLMISNIASMLIIGITRLLVENKWDIETFGKLSFTLSISNMFMTFINAVGIVIFPLLRRTNRSNLKILYEQIRTVFVPLTFSLLLFFNPIRIILENWLPAYKDSLRFMGVLFPMVIYEGRMSLLINTYLKTIRKEKYILLANMASLLLTIVLSVITIFYFNNIDLVVLGIMICLAFRCILAELLLSKVLEINIVGNLIQEIIITIIFIVSNMLLSNLVSFILFLICFSIYIAINTNKIKVSFKQLVSAIRG